MTSGRLLWRLAQIFPALQSSRYVAVFPDEIEEGAEIEFFTLLCGRRAEIKFTG